MTFLYELWEGVCSKSYGMNVARMAGVDSKVVSKAEKISQKVEAKSNAIQILRLLSEPLQLTEKYKQLLSLTSTLANALEE